MTANNEKIVVDKKIQDFDAVSLYPSAMKEMPGIPKGKPKVLSTEECQNKDIFKYDAFYVEINIKRIEKSLGLLKNTDDTVLSVAAACGYNNTANFNRIFRKITGLTPRQYRVSRGK